MNVKLPANPGDDFIGIKRLGANGVGLSEFYLLFFSQRSGR